MGPTETKTNGSGRFSCDSTYCGSITSLFFVFPDDVPKPISLYLQIGATSDNFSQLREGSVDIETGKIDIQFALPEDMNDIQIFVLLSIDWGGFYYLPPYDAFSSKITTMNLLAGSTILRIFEIHSIWADLVSKNPSTEIIDSNTSFDYNFSIQPSLPPITQPMSTFSISLSFRQYYAHVYLNSLLLITSGINHWYLLPNSASQRPYCLINGLVIPVESVNEQTVRLTLTEVLRRRLTHGHTVHISCGGTNTGVFFVDSRPRFDGTFKTKPSSFISIIPFYNLRTVSNLFYPLTGGVIQLDDGLFNLDNLSPFSIELNPTYSYADDKFGSEGPAAISAAFELDLPTIEHYSKPIQIEIEIFGLGGEKGNSWEKKNKNDFPYVIIGIEPDYASDEVHYEPTQKDKRAHLPTNLVSSYHILPLVSLTPDGAKYPVYWDPASYVWNDEQTIYTPIIPFKTPILTLENGFFSPNLNPQSRNTAKLFEKILPKRYLNIVLPVSDNLYVLSEPIIFLVKIKYLSDQYPTTTITKSINLSPNFHKRLTTVNNNNNSSIEDSDLPNWSFTSTIIDPNIYSFEFRSTEFVDFPAHFIATYPLLRHRLTFDKSKPITCQVSDKVCVEIFKNKIECEFLNNPDISFTFSSTFNPYKAGFTIKTSPEFIPSDIDRRVQCNGIGIVHVKPDINDYRDITANEDDIIKNGKNNDYFFPFLTPTTKKREPIPRLYHSSQGKNGGWGLLERGGVTTTASHTFFSSNGVLLGFFDETPAIKDMDEDVVGLIIFAAALLFFFLFIGLCNWCVRYKKAVPPNSPKKRVTYAKTHEERHLVPMEYYQEYY
jgi:hypothetical protein